MNSNKKKIVTDKDLLRGKEVGKDVDQWRQGYNDKQLENLPDVSLEEFEQLILKTDPKPDLRNISQLTALEKADTIHKQDVYKVLKDLTPYLLRRLVYESYHAKSSLNRIRATKAILNKILPDVAASEVSVSVEDQPQLVIVKANKKRDED